MKDRAQAGAVQEAQAAAHAQGLGAGRLEIGWEMAREAMFQARRYGTRLLSPKAGGSAARFDELPDIGAAYERLEQHIADIGVALNLPSTT